MYYVSNGAIARAGDDRTEDAGGDAGTQRGRFDGTRRADQRAQHPIEAPLACKLGSPTLGQAVVNAGPSVLERLERRGGGQFSAAYGEPQAVTRHRIDEAGRIPREQQTIDGSAGSLDRQRSEHDGRMRETRVGKPKAQVCIARKLMSQQRDRIAQRGVTRPGWLDNAHVRQAAGHRRHADVAAAADVHFAKRRPAR